jgi:hypothetical protein
MDEQKTDSLNDNDNDNELRERINTDFKAAFEYWSALHKEMEKDCSAALGEQWEKRDIEKMRAVGKYPLTINKIRPNLQLLEGIEAQNRTDITAVAVGFEDEIKGEIVTRLLKNAFNESNANIKLSDCFSLTLMSGEGFIKPYIDYTKDIVNGELKLKVKTGFEVLIDPASVEYDLSDANFIIELTSGLTKDEVKELYPDKADEIDSCANTTLDLSAYGKTTDGASDLGRDNYKDNPDIELSGYASRTRRDCDIIEYHYKKRIEVYYAVNLDNGGIQEFASRDEAEKFIAGFAMVDKESGAIIPANAKIIKKFKAEIWTAIVLGKDAILDNNKAWSYPDYDGFPIIPQFCFRFPTKLPKDKSQLLIQGLARPLRDLNYEYNKRRTQELHILNTSANSGWMYRQGAIADERLRDWEEFGATPGAMLEFQGEPPQKIMPTPLSQGHAQLAAETANDMKETTGINTDLLAMNESQASGRAIALRQRQGMVMVQKIFDNYSTTKKMFGKFLLTQLKELYDVDSVLKVLGKAFIEQSFPLSNIPLNLPPQLQGMGFEQLPIELRYQMLNEQKQKQLAACSATIKEVLEQSRDLSKYDIVVGESAQSDSVKIGNYFMLMELVEKGIPIPPEILIEETLLPSGTKAKIKQLIEERQQAQQSAVAQKAQGQPLPTPPSPNGNFQ